MRGIKNQGMGELEVVGSGDRGMGGIRDWGNWGIGELRDGWDWGVLESGNEGSGNWGMGDKGIGGIKE